MNSYHQARSAALKELADAAKQRDLLEKRIARLKQTVSSLDALIEGDETVSESIQALQTVGITDAVRNALKIASSPRTAIEVRDWLANSGYDLSEQENPLASIHTILKRLTKAGEAQADINAERKATYRWIGGGENAFRAAFLQANANAALAVQQAVLGLNANKTSDMAALVGRSMLEMQKRLIGQPPPVTKKDEK